MANEHDCAAAIMLIAADSGGVCTFEQAFARSLRMVKLTRENLAPSVTRLGERMWQQLVRNIRSHHEARGNFVQLGLLKHRPHVGFSLTPTGRALVGMFRAS